MAFNQSLIPVERIESLILQIRGQKVILDKNLAQLYNTETRILNQAVSRNIKRFPSDFMFKLTVREYDRLMSQFVISNTSGRGGIRKLPRVFTEQGVAMLSSVLKSERAIEVNIEIMRTFIRLRRMIATQAGLAKKLEALEKKYDRRFRVVFDALRQSMMPSASKSRPIGFQVEDSIRQKNRKKLTF